MTDTTKYSTRIDEPSGNKVITIDRGGKARDAIELGDLVRQRVFDACGIDLQREVVVWRRDQSETPA